MSENLYCHGQKKTNLKYDKGWYRTFKTPPRMGGPIREMLQDFIDKDELDKVVIFFMTTCKADYDYSCYLLGELIEGEL